MRMKNKEIIAIIAVAALLSMTGCSDKTNKQSTGVTDIQNSDDIKSGVKTPDTGEWAGFPEKVETFSAKDLKGNDVTDDIFKDKDLTVVNVWGTFCSPCIEEMPELGEWAKSMPENVQIIGLIADVENEEDANFELANNIVKSAKADYRQIIANEDFSNIMNEITGVPTTFFVDSEGNIVGEPILGADVDAYKSFVEEYING